MRRTFLIMLAAVVACGRTPAREASDGTASGSTAFDAAALPPGHVPIPATASGKVLTPRGQSLLDSGNASFRAHQLVEALAFYRHAAAEVPGHAAPWFGTYMVARAMKDSALADSALRMVRERAPGMQGHPSGLVPRGGPAVSPHSSSVP